MPMKKLLILLFVVLTQGLIQAQSTFIPYNRDYYHLIDRFQIKYGGEDNLLQTTFKPIRRVDLSNFLLKIADKYERFSPRDKFNFEYLMNDNWEWTDSPYNKNDKDWWAKFYNKKSDFLFYQTNSLSLRINPVFNFGVGKDQDTENSLFNNTRGVEAQGMIDDKIGFYTFLSTTQSIFPDYVASRVFPNGTLPYEAFWKRFKDDGFDYFHARGYITFNLTKSIDVQAGYDKQFIGNGMRSMIMSDFSSPFLFGKINTRLGKFQYTNMFAQMTSDIVFNQGFPDEGDYPTKFMAMHRFGLDVTPTLNIGVSEYIVTREAQIEYFNPIIFLRATELFRGSPDNVLISADFNYNYKGKARIYGQLIFDDFEIDAIRSGTKGWEIKFGTQLGIKLIDAFNIPNLDLQAESNISRPYFYAHEDTQLSFTNGRNPLAHPFGSNFKEIVLAGTYQPLDRLSVYGKLIRTKFGADRDGLNFGGNPLLDTDTRVMETGVLIGQGVSTTNTYLELTGSYMVLHNLFIDLKNVYRNFESEIATRSSNTFMTMLSLRWNLPQREHEF